MRLLCAFVVGCLVGGVVVAALCRDTIREQADRIWVLEMEGARSKDLMQFCDEVVGAVYPYGTKP